MAPTANARRLPCGASPPGESPFDTRSDRAENPRSIHPNVHASSGPGSHSLASPGGGCREHWVANTRLLRRVTDALAGALRHGEPTDEAPSTITSPWSGWSMPVQVEGGGFLHRWGPAKQPHPVQLNRDATNGRPPKLNEPLELTRGEASKVPFVES